MASQQILFTVMPRGIAHGTGALPVSVYVSPRLSGEDRLGAYPDWLRWTANLQANGLSLTFRCEGRVLTRALDTAPLRPALWDAMFDERTYVRSHVFPDYAERAIHSYPVRYALSTLKATYQRAGLELALPDHRPPIRGEEHDSYHRRLVRELVDGLAVNWDDDRGARLRAYYRQHFGEPAAAFFPRRYRTSDLGPDGLLKQMPPQAADRFFRQRMSEQFAVMHHVPPGAPITPGAVDFETLVDFHQALSSLGSYPALLRALGLVLDFALPTDFLRPGSPPLGRLSVADVPGAAWKLAATSVVPGLKPLETAYVLFDVEPRGSHVFATAPGALGGLTPQLETFGLLDLAATSYGIAQVDVDGALHKTIALAEAWQSGRLQQAPSDHREVFDSSATLPSIRSAGLTLFADGRALKLLERIRQAKAFDDALAANTAQTRPFFAEDLIHGYRLDVWDSHTRAWHSLHRRDALYEIGAASLTTHDEEGFTQLAASQAAPGPAQPPEKDLYLHEAIARWAGWSLSVPPVERALSSDADPAKALEDEAKNEPATPFEMTTAFRVVAGSLPSLRFGRSYRMRARVVDLCGNGLGADDPLANGLSRAGFVLPADAEGLPYLRYEPVAAPIVVARDVRAITDPGSSIDRLVIRSFNAAVSLDDIAADTTAADRHLVPPRASVDMAEKLGMFDDASGKLVASPAMYALIAARDQGELGEIEAEVKGQRQRFPLDAAAQIDPLPYLPDVLSRGVALRDLPGTGEGTLGSVRPDGDPAAALVYAALDDPSPRPGSATLVGFGGQGDWQRMLSLRLALAEADAMHRVPTWDGAARVLTVYAPKASVSLVPLSSVLAPDDLKRMGVWQWIRERIDTITAQSPDPDVLRTGDEVDLIAHVLQRAVEGGHWMITPPRLLTLVHAVQQPIGVPQFRAISVQHVPYGDPTRFPFDETRDPSPEVLQTSPEKAPTAETELASITSWRRPGAVDAFVLGGLQVHAASTEKIDLLAEWSDPIDDMTKRRVMADANREARSAHVDEVPIRTLRDGMIEVRPGTPNERAVGYYDADHDLLCFVRAGDRLGNLMSPDTRDVTTIRRDAAPRHHLNDTKHHRITYTPVATSRFREYFAPDSPGGFTRAGPSVVVDVPASARPDTPTVAYVVPSFGWQRQTETNVKRSVRFGGGLRIYLERPWYSSGDGELLGVTLYAAENGTQVDHEAWKSHVTQWGADPIWQTSPLATAVPGIADFPDAVASEEGLRLAAPAPGRVNVVGFAVQFDEERQLWFADVTIDAGALSYAPFVRLALVRYQPHAIPDAKLSRVVLADFAQLTPSRAAVVTADPYHPRRLRVTVSGVAPSGPAPVVAGTQPTYPATAPSVVTVSVQQRRAGVAGDLAWNDAPTGVATVTDETAAATTSDLIRWSGVVELAKPAAPGELRLLIREHEILSSNYVVTVAPAGAARVLRTSPGRLVYAETIALDEALAGGPVGPTGTKLEG